MQKGLSSFSPAELQRQAAEPLQHLQDLSLHKIEIHARALRDRAHLTYEEHAYAESYMLFYRARLLLEHAYGIATLPGQADRLAASLEHVQLCSQMVLSVLEEMARLASHTPAVAPASPPSQGHLGGYAHRPLRRVLIPDNVIGEFAMASDANSRQLPNGVETCALLLGCEVPLQDVPGEGGAGPCLLITHMVFPPQVGQESTCELTEAGNEALVDYVIRNDLLQLGWIHSHPSQSVFMSSHDQHTHCVQQQTLEEAIAIVYSPFDPQYGGRSNYAVFRLTDSHSSSEVVGRPQPLPYPDVTPAPRLPREEAVRMYRHGLHVVTSCRPQSSNFHRHEQGEHITLYEQAAAHAAFKAASTGSGAAGVPPVTVVDLRAAAAAAAPEPTPVPRVEAAAAAGAAGAAAGEWAVWGRPQYTLPASAGPPRSPIVSRGVGVSAGGAGEPGGGSRGYEAARAATDAALRADQSAAAVVAAASQAASRAAEAAAAARAERAAAQAAAEAAAQASAISYLSSTRFPRPSMAPPGSRSAAPSLPATRNAYNPRLSAQGHIPMSIDVTRGSGAYFPSVHQAISSAGGGGSSPLPPPLPLHPTSPGLTPMPASPPPMALPMEAPLRS